MRPEQLTKSDRDRAYKDLPTERQAELTSAINSPPEDEARSKQSLLDEAFSNKVAGDKAASDGDEEAAERYYENERICVEAAETAPDDQ